MPKTAAGNEIYASAAGLLLTEKIQSVWQQMTDREGELDKRAILCRNRIRPSSYTWTDRTCNVRMADRRMVGQMGAAIRVDT